MESVAREALRGISGPRRTLGATLALVLVVLAACQPIEPDGSPRPPLPPLPETLDGFRADAWFLPDDDSLGFVEIPGGPFTMGSDPAADRRLPVWEVVHHLVRVLESDGETGAAGLVRQLGGLAETARELAYRLYAVAERKNRAAEALSYNALVQSWPEIARLARQEAPPEQGGLFGE